MANGCIVRIKTEYKDDEGILQHELCHCEQWYKTLGLHSLLYPLSKTYRLNSEVAAYKVQLKYCSDKADGAERFAERICRDYGLDVTVVKEDVIKMLREK